MRIEIKPSEIEHIDQLGTLDGEDVKLVKTKGGLYLAIGKKKKESQPEVMAAGSHPAIVRYNMEKSYLSFQPSMMKSETFGSSSQVAEMSDLLDDQSLRSGVGLYVVKTHNHFDFILTKNEEEILSYQATAVDDDLILFKSEKLVNESVYSYVPIMATLAAIVAIDENKSRLIHANKFFDPKKILSKS